MPPARNASKREISRISRCSSKFGRLRIARVRRAPVVVLSIIRRSLPRRGVMTMTGRTRNTLRRYCASDRIDTSCAGCRSSLRSAPSWCKKKSGQGRRSATERARPSAMRGREAARGRSTRAGANAAGQRLGVLVSLRRPPKPTAASSSRPGGNFGRRLFPHPRASACSIRIFRKRCPPSRAHLIFENTIPISVFAAWLRAGLRPEIAVPTPRSRPRPAISFNVALAAFHSGRTAIRIRPCAASIETLSSGPANRPPIISR